MQDAMDQAEREPGSDASGKPRQLEGVYLLDKTTGQVRFERTPGIGSTPPNTRPPHLQVLRNGAPSGEDGPRMGARDEFGTFTALDAAPGWNDTKILRLDRKSLLWRETASYVDPLDATLDGGPVEERQQSGYPLSVPAAALKLVGMDAYILDGDTGATYRYSHDNADASARVLHHLPVGSTSGKARRRRPHTTPRTSRRAARRSLATPRVHFRARPHWRAAAREPGADQPASAQRAPPAHTRTARPRRPRRASLARRCDA